MGTTKNIPEDLLLKLHDVHQNYHVPVVHLAPLVGLSYQGLQKKWAAMGLEDLGFDSIKSGFAPVPPTEARAYEFMYTRMGISSTSIARIFGRTPATVSNNLKAMGVELSKHKPDSIVMRIPIQDK